MKSLSLSLAGLVLAVPVFAASASSKPSWQWTPEERISARFDESARRLRVELRVRARAASKASRSGPEVYDVVEGKDHPELLMPHEIFSTFTRAAFVIDDDTSAIMRRDAAEKATALGLPKDFLDVVARESAEFVALQRREGQLREQMTARGANSGLVWNDIKSVQAQECPARAAAIGRLRTIYGREQFDKYLYTAVAPGVFYTFFEPQDVKKLVAEEAGCETAGLSEPSLVQRASLRHRLRAFRRLRHALAVRIGSYYRDRRAVRGRELPVRQRLCLPHDRRSSSS